MLAHTFKILYPGLGTPCFPKIHRHRFAKRAQFVTSGFPIKAASPTREIEMGALVVTRAEELVRRAMKGNDASHDAARAFRVRDLALSLAHEGGLSSSPDSLLIVELAAVLHDIGDYKYVKYGDVVAYNA